MTYVYFVVIRVPFYIESGKIYVGNKLIICINIGIPFENYVLELLGIGYLIRVGLCSAAPCKSGRTRTLYHIIKTTGYTAVRHGSGTGTFRIGVEILNGHANTACIGLCERYALICAVCEFYVNLYLFIIDIFSDSIFRSRECLYRYAADLTYQTVTSYG